MQWCNNVAYYFLKPLAHSILFHKLKNCALCNSFLNISDGRTGTFSVQWALSLHMATMVSVLYIWIKVVHMFTAAYFALVSLLSHMCSSQVEEMLFHLSEGFRMSWARVCVLLGGVVVVCVCMCVFEGCVRRVIGQRTVIFHSQTGLTHHALGAVDVSRTCIH